LSEEDQDVSDSLANFLVSPRLDPAGVKHLERLVAASPDLALAWLKAEALAVVRGEPSVPPPDASRIPPDHVQALLQELTALPPRGIPTAFRRKSFDERLALIEHLSRLPAWPAALGAAHLTIMEVSAASEEAAIFSPEAWIGRVMDAAACGDLQAAAEKVANMDRGVAATVLNRGPLSGVRLVVRPATWTTMPPESLDNRQVPKLEGKPAPSAYLTCMLTTTTHRTAFPLHYSRLLWKDPALNQEWRDRYFKPGSKPIRGFDPTPVERRLAEIFALKPEMRRPFQLSFQITLIRAKSAKDSEPELDLDTEL
jgi:hypothetical protein